jgi:hypothetical protein
MNGLVVQDFEIEIGGKSNAKKIGGKKLGRGRRWQVVVSKWDVHHLRDLRVDCWGQAGGQAEILEKNTTFSLLITT